MFQKLIKLIKANKYLLLLVFVAVGTHLIWFEFNKSLTFSDWYFWQPGTLKEYYFSQQTWINHWEGFGEPNIQIYFNSFEMIWSILANFGLSFNVSSRLTLYIPIALLGFLSPYFLLFKITKDKTIAFIVALMYASTTYFLDLQTAHLNIAFVYALSPAIIYLFINALQKNKIREWILFASVFAIGNVYEIRICYILSFFLFFYFIYFYWSKIRVFIKGILTASVLIILLNLFWLLPTVFGGIFSQVLAVADRGLFGDQLFNIIYSFTMFQWSWTGSLPNRTFDPQPIPIFFWAIPMILYIVLLKGLKQYGKQILFYLMVLTIGIFLTKQSAEPFPFIYALLYKYFPGFNLFREASKFYLLIDLAYSVLVGYCLLIYKNQIKSGYNSFIYKFLVLLILLLSFFNFYPLISGTIGTLFKERIIPSDYTIINSKIEQDREYSRILSIPIYSRWVLDTDLHPRISFINEIYSDWKVITGKLLKTEAETMVSVLNKDEFSNLLNVASIKYVMVPLEDNFNDDNFFVYYGGSRNYYINNLNKLNYLTKVNYNTKQLIVYENKSFKPHIYITNEEETIRKNVRYEKINYQMITNTQYKVNLGQVNKLTYINFSEAFHPGWKLRIGNFNWLDALFRKNYFLSDKFHIKNDATLNSYLLDPKTICKEFSCLRNKNGSYDINLTLYFAPQSLFYLGSIVSIGTIILIFTFLIFTFRKDKYEGKI